MYSTYLITGSNLGNRLEQLQKAAEALNTFAGTITATSSVYETEAWGKEGLPSHLNQALQLETPLGPLALLQQIHLIEEQLGRVRQEKWGVRMIDIDIIFFEHDIIDLPQLQIPHPLMQHRNFVLAPLCEIAPDFIHPLLHKTNLALLQASDDGLRAERYPSKNR
jgi:2-amino-4-hydroxy-6-hydroxymethyldihydropteridine diphosphokinase